MASALASTSALPNSSAQPGASRTSSGVWTSPPSFPPSSHHAVDHDPPERFMSTASGHGPKLKPRAHTWSRTSRHSASHSLTSLLKMGLGCLLLTMAMASEKVKAMNSTALTGTWVSGDGKVSTGISFYNPITKNFTMPTSGGVSYSFVEDLSGGGHFETSTFTFTSNPGTNRCFTAALTWQHGTFTNNANGSLSLTPYAQDGLVQVMAPCAAESTAQYSYSQFELIPTWYNYVEPLSGFADIDNPVYAMQMYNDDGTGAAGTPKNIMYMVARPPTMLPAEQLFEVVLNE